MIKQIVALIFNIFIAFSEAAVLLRFFRKEGKQGLIYYTTLSNLFAMVVSAFYASAAVALPAGGAAQTADAVALQLLPAMQMLRFMAATGLTITFLVVVFILSREPACGGLRHLLLDESMLFTHFLCPVVSLVSFVFLEDTSLLGESAVHICLIPTACYAVTAVVMNLLKLWDGPYPFLKVYKNGWKKSICWAIVLMVSFSAIAAGLLTMNRLFH